ncbi:hypothetical protein [Salinigranum marinum]|uniref:hypothetical protein n=1 Tax=Salinigranum marinum TaxID=1515595 RepID=UPI002989FEE9|nr:hypothetical protein [Salinigranum marinum]
MRIAELEVGPVTEDGQILIDNVPVSFESLDGTIVTCRRRSAFQFSMRDGNPRESDGIFTDPVVDLIDETLYSISGGQWPMQCYDAANTNYRLRVFNWGCATPPVAHRMRPLHIESIR